MAIKLTSDFETLPISQGWQVYEYPANRPDAMSRSNTVARSGTYSCKVHLESTDDNAQFGNRRTELTYNNSNNPDDTLRWYAVSWYFPAATNVSDNREHSIIQWHDKSQQCSTSPPAALQVKNGRFRFYRQYSTANYCSQPGSIVGPIFTDLGAVPLDQWVDFVFYYYPSTTTAGEIKVWINNVQVFSFVGITTYVGSKFPYLKLGLYKWLWNGTAVTPGTVEYYMDRVRVADLNSTYADVAIPSGGTNVLPNVSAGNSQVVRNSVTQVTLTGTATDPDGTIASRLWTLVSGPNSPTIVSPTALTTQVTGMTPGLYTFQLSVTDNSGGTAQANTTVRVNLLPTVNLTPNVTSYPAGTTSIYLTSVVADGDGTVVSYQWSVVSGPGDPNIVTATAQNTTVTGMGPGVYRFNLTVTDNNGDTGEKEINITIEQSYTLKLGKKLQ